MKKLNYSKDRLAEARDLRLRWYNGEKIERTPFAFSVTTGANSWMAGNPYNFQEMRESAEKAVEGVVSAIQYQFDTFPDCDYLPVMNPFYTGQGILASMYGARQLVTPLNPPFTEGRIFKDIHEAGKISNDFEIEDTVWGKLLKEHVQRFVDATDGQIPVGVADYQSPYGTATKLMPNEELMMAMYDEPKLVHQFFGLITDGIIKLIDAMEKWIGPEVLAHNLTNPIPGACGAILWDDYISVISPEMHKQFCAPYNIKIYERYGRGHLHTCGPYFPSYLEACLACKPRSMDVAIMRGMGKTREDMLAFLDITKVAGIRLYGSLTVFDKSIFEAVSAEPGEAFYKQFIQGGLMPSGAGSYEQGLEFRDMIRRIDREIFGD